MLFSSLLQKYRSRESIWILLLAVTLFLSLIGGVLIFWPSLRADLPELPKLAEHNRLLEGLLRLSDAEARARPNSVEEIGKLSMVYHANLFYDHARIAYQIAAQVNPSDCRWYYYQARLEEETGRHEAFFDLLEKTLELCPNHQIAGLKLAEVLFKKDELERAKEQYAGIHHRDHSFVPAVLGLARIAVREENWSRVIEYLEPVSLHNPQLRRPHQRLAEAYQALGLSEKEAEEREVLKQSGLDMTMPVQDDFRNQLDSLCMLPSPLLKLASSAEFAGDFKKMLLFSRRAAQAGPNDADALHFLSRALILEGNDEPSAVAESMDLRDKALRLQPENPEPLLLLGQTLIAHHHLTAAVSTMRLFLAGDPDSAQGHNNLGTALARQGKLEQAIAHYSRAVQIDPEFAKAFSNLGSALARQGKLEKAITQYSTAVRIDPGSADFHYKLAVALTERRRSKEAIVHFGEVLRMRPDDLDAHKNIGIILAREGQSEKAVVHLSQVLRMRPEDVETHSSLGIALAMLGKLEDAIAHFTEVLRINPNYSPARLNLQKARRHQRMAGTGGEQ